MLGLEFGVGSEAECAQLCWDVDECTFYSYYSLESSPLQLACAKLSECYNRNLDISVLSGPSDCTDRDLVVESNPSCFNDDHPDFFARYEISSVSVTAPSQSAV